MFEKHWLIGCKNPNLIIFICRLLFCVVGVYLELSASTSIECKYGTGDWNIVKNVYFCSINNNPSITTQESATITSISGPHQSGKTNSDVVGFNANTKTFIYFPNNLETFFKNIKIIQIHNCNLTEVHQEDLKPFPNLFEIYLSFNKLEVLEEGLFDFNPDLEFIYFGNNKIVHIEPNVFDPLSKLRYLTLHSNSCINKKAQNSISEVKNVIQAAKSQCINSEFSSLKSQLESLEKDSKTLNSQEFSEKLAALEKTLNASKFKNYMQNKLSDLKAIQAKELEKTSTTTTTQAPTTASTTPESINFESCLELEPKIDNIALSLKDLIGQTPNEAFSNNNNQCEAFTEALRNQSEAIGRIDNRTEALTEAMDTKLEILEENVENTRTLSLRQMQNFRDEVKTDHAGILTAIRLRTDKIEKQIKEIKEQNQKIEDKLAKIMKGLKIDN